MPFRELPVKERSQANLRVACIALQKDVESLRTMLPGYLRDTRHKDHYVRYSARSCAVSLQRSMAIKSAKERYMRGLDEGLVLDHIGPRCTFCGSCHNVRWIGGSSPYTCGGNGRIAF